MKMILDKALEVVNGFEAMTPEEYKERIETHKNTPSANTINQLKELEGCLNTIDLKGEASHENDK